MKKIIYLGSFVLFILLVAEPVSAACVGGTWRGYRRDPPRCAVLTCFDSGSLQTVSCDPNVSGNKSCCGCTAGQCNTGSTQASENCSDYTTPNSCAGANFSGWECNNGVTCSWSGPVPQPTSPPAPTFPPLPTTTTAPGFPTSTPRPVPTAVPVACSGWCTNAGQGCPPGNVPAAGSCGNGGACCTAGPPGNQCNGQVRVIAVSAQIVGPDPIIPNYTIVRVSWATEANVDPHHFGLTILRSPSGQFYREWISLAPNIRQYDVSLPPDTYQFRVGGKDNCDLADSRDVPYTTTIPVPISCAARFGPLLPGELTRNGGASTFNVQVFPTGTPLTVGASVTVDPINTGLTVAPSAQTSLTVGYPTTFTFTETAAFQSPNNAILSASGNVGSATGLVQCPVPGTTTQTVRNPSTTFFLAGGGGDVIAAGVGAAGELRSNLANPVPVTDGGTYFAHNPKPGINDITNLGLAFSGQLTAPLNANNINAAGWYVNTGAAGFARLKSKRENTYEAIRDRIEAQLTAPMLEANSMTRVDQITGFPCAPDTCVAGIHVIKYTGGNIGTTANAPVVVTKPVLLFSDNGGVTTILSPIFVPNDNIFFGFFTQGSITIAQEVGAGASTGTSIGNQDITSAAYQPDMRGVYFAGGDINFGSGNYMFGCTPAPTPLPPAVYNPATAQCARQIRINGSVIGMNRVNLNRRHIGDKPSIYIHFVPNYAYTLYSMGLRQKKYQELLAP